jgi:hypothetical protein
VQIGRRRRLTKRRGKMNSASGIFGVVFFSFSFLLQKLIRDSATTVTSSKIKMNHLISFEITK